VLHRRRRSGGNRFGAAAGPPGGRRAGPREAWGLPPEHKAGKNRIHIDLTSTSIDDQKQTVERLVELGARHIDIGQGPADEHVVLADPEGNEFCVIEPDGSSGSGPGRVASRPYTQAMIETSVRRRISDLAVLRELVGTPSERAVRKELSQLDAHCRAFIERSPFMLLGTSNRKGRCDVSPKGDGPGFVLALDEHTLIIPDRPGNRRLDSLQNILDNPHVGLLFLIPGMDETLRVNGTAALIQDDSILDLFAIDDRRPLLAIEVHVEEAFLHCARSFLRAKLWDPQNFMPRDEMPSLARMIGDQLRPSNRSDSDHKQVVEDNERSIGEAYRCLY
jgi:uncharacterized protein